ncbi:putative vacuolar protein sorting-associated protein [Metarhizium anisopliae]
MANKTFDYGDLRITMTSGYRWVWDDTGSGARRSVCLWTPNAQGNLCPVGDYAAPEGYWEINGHRASLLVGQNPNTTPKKPAVARPTGYTKVWGDWGSGGKHDGIIWHPTAPAGYVALGDVGTYGYDTKPDVNRIWCVREDLVGYGKFLATSTWDDGGSGAGSDCSLWAVQPGDVGVDGAERLPVLADTFVARSNYARPGGDQARVLLLPMPKKYDEYDVAVPKVEARHIPSRGDQIQSTEQCKATLPFHFFFPPNHQDSLDNIRNPFLTVSRTIAWYVEGVWVNDGEGDYSRQQRILYGVSKEQREEMTHTVGVEISATYGIKLSSVSVTLNYQFTHTSSTSLTEYSEREVTETINVPKHSASVLFTKHVWIKVYRLDSPVVLRQMEMTANDDFRMGSCTL